MARCIDLFNEHHTVPGSGRRNKERGRFLVWAIVDVITEVTHTLAVGNISLDGTSRGHLDIRQPASWGRDSTGGKEVGLMDVAARE